MLWHPPCEFWMQYILFLAAHRRERIVEDHTGYDSHLVAALGIHWAHAVTIRLVLDAKSGLFNKLFTCKWLRCHETNSCSFVISECNFFFLWVLFIWDILPNQLCGCVSFRMYENLFQGFISRWECAGLASFLFLNALTQHMIFQKIITNYQSLFSSFVCFVVSIFMWVSFKAGLFC